MKKVMIGNHAAAHGARLAQPEVIAAYPITPQTSIIEELAEMVAKGTLKSEYVRVESEHSAMALVMGAAAAGARVFTATSSQGLALMHEMLHYVAGARLPVVMVNVNRALAPPWNIWADQTDSLAQRETGWVQVYCESNQEVLDSVIMAFAVAEKQHVPIMLIEDAFFLSHTSEVVDVPEQEEVSAYLPPRQVAPREALTPGEAHAFGSLGKPDVYTEIRLSLHRDLLGVEKVWEETAETFEKAFGRRWGVYEAIDLEDAEVVLVLAGAMASTARGVVSEMRAAGKKVGLLKLRLFRPFPAQTLRDLLKGIPKVAVVDRNISLGHCGVMAQELRSALSLLGSEDRPTIFGYIAGLGGRDVTPEIIEEMIHHTFAETQPAEDDIWVGVHDVEPTI